MSNSMLRHERIARILPVSVMGVLFVLYGTPLFVLLFGSFQPASSVPRVTFEAFGALTVENYVAFFERGGAQSLLNSAIIAIGTTLVVAIVGVPAAYWISRIAPRFAGVTLLVIVFLQMIPAASSVIPLYRVLAAWGLVGTLPAVILALAATLLPWALLLMGPYFAAIPREISEAAAVDGAGPFRQFWSIVVPLARNGVVTVCILTFMVSWGEFVYAINFLADPKLYPASGVLTTYISALFTDWPGVMAASVMTALPIIIFFLVFQRRLSDGLSAGALKG